MLKRSESITSNVTIHYIWHCITLHLILHWIALGSTLHLTLCQKASPLHLTPVDATTYLGNIASEKVPNPENIHFKKYLKVYQCTLCQPDTSGCHCCLVSSWLGTTLHSLLPLFARENHIGGCQWYLHKPTIQEKIDFFSRFCTKHFEAGWGPIYWGGNPGQSQADLVSPLISLLGNNFLPIWGQWVNNWSIWGQQVNCLSVSQAVATMISFVTLKRK